MSGCDFCAVWLAHKHDPAVARILDRLRDELTVCELRASLPAHVVARMRRKISKPRSSFDHTRRSVDDPSRRVLAHLAGGPLRLRELAEAVYGLAAYRAEPDRCADAARGLLRRLLLRGTVVRVGHGWYADPDAREEMRHEGPDDLERVLRRGRPDGGCGWTAAELAERFDVTTAGVHRWLKALRRRGVDVAVDEVRRPGLRRTYRYRIAPAVRGRVA